jgi:hypothetical protein
MLDQGEDRPGLTWLAVAAGLLPTLVVQEFCRIILLPQMDEQWGRVAAELADQPAAQVEQAAQVLLGNAASVLPVMIVFLVVLEWLVKPSRRTRGLAAAVVAVGYNLTVLLGVVAVAVTMAVAASVTNPKTPATQTEAIFQPHQSFETTSHETRTGPGLRQTS